MKKILCVCLSATFQRTITFNRLVLSKVNRSEEYRRDASGKAVNSARVLNQLEEGCVEVLCPLGELNVDPFVELAKRDNLKLAYVTIPGATRACWTLLDKEAGTTTELVVSEPDISHYGKEKIQIAEIKLLKYLSDRLSEVDGVLLAGSKPKWWSADLYPAICGIVKDRGKFFLADYTGTDLIKTIESTVPDVIKVNDEEYCSTFGIEYPPQRELLKKHICENSLKLGNMIVVTRGTDKTYAAKEGKFFSCPVEVVKAINTTACGDSFNAGFIYEYLNTGDFEKSLKKGTWCAARNAEVEIPGSIKCI